jgi:DUF4097 and DUF4098 domain-containing protein YvlB
MRLQSLLLSLPLLLVGPRGFTTALAAPASRARACEGTRLSQQPTSGGAPQLWNFGAGTSPTVRIDNVAGSIRVQPSADGQVHIEATKRGGDAADRDRITVQASAQGSGVQARVCCGPCDGNGRDDCNGRAWVDFVVRAPGASRLLLNGVSTDVQASGIAGDHEINTVSGDVEVSGSRQLRLKTVSGDSKVDGASGLRLNTVSGDLKASNVRGETHFQSVSGDAEWRGACAAGCRIQAETTSGDLKLAVGAAGSFDLAFQSRSGDYNDDLGTSVGSREQNPTRIRARAGRGEGRVEFESVSGDLSLTR